MDEMLKWLERIFQIAPQSATLIALVFVFIKYGPKLSTTRHEDCEKFVKREECHGHIDALRNEMRGISEDVKMLVKAHIKTDS